MKFPHLFGILLASLISFCFSSCKKSADPTPGPPVWSSGYPQVPGGAVTADVVLQADRKSTVYWVVADQPVSLTPTQLKAQATATTNLPAIKFKGVSIIDANVKKTETVQGLTQHKKYYAYLVGERFADTLIQRDIKSFNFTTYYRQDTSKYTSVAENRHVMFLIYRPENVLKYPDQKYPICFFLGGNGEVADTAKINMIRNGSLPEYLSKGNDVPMMVMSIQHVVSNWNTTLIDEGVIYGLANYPVDTKKVYLTGISGGGFGCWNYSVDHADKLAAIIPISGGGNPGKACNLKNVPVWAFCNQTDGTVDPINSKNMVKAVNACPPTTVATLTIFPDAGHDCWRRVYDQNNFDWTLPGKNDLPKVDVYSWLLSKSK